MGGGRIEATNNICQPQQGVESVPAPTPAASSPIKDLMNKVSAVVCGLFSLILNALYCVKECFRRLLSKCITPIVLPSMWLKSRARIEELGRFAEARFRVE